MMMHHGMARVRLLGVMVALGLACVVSAAGCGSTDGTEGSSSSNGTGAAGATHAGGGGGECSAELCDGLDNDCDNEVDEGCPCIEGDTQSCFSADPDLIGVGECAEGVQTCDLQGEWGACDGEVTPTDESCDGVDNDCDTQIDEGFGNVTCGLGICQVTVDECVDGVSVPCLPGEPNPTETCDGADDDCDGQVDEGCSCVNGSTQPCYTGSSQTQGVGECQDGLQTCAGGQYGACVGDVTPTNELCDGLDNDCDNQTDENDPGGGATCATGLFGVCNPGIEHCVGGQIVCQQNVQPSTETCNGLDDDCDGPVDENNPGGGGSCNTGNFGICGPGTFQCQNATLQCVQTNQAAPETCNGLDDDCDNAIDEGNPGGGAACTTSLLGLCGPGTLQCQNGSLQCNQNNFPQTEVCNGLDDDCDGPIDENNPGGGGPCTVPGQQGLCANGTLTCLSGSLQCPQSVWPTAEICTNGLDEDCDGVPDDGCGGGCNGQSIQTTYSSNNGQSGNMFDLVALGSNLNILSFDGNFDPGTYTVEIYYKSGTHQGFEGTSSAWTLAGSASVTSNGTDVATPIPIAVNVAIAAGQTYGFYITVTTTGTNYTGGTTLGAVYVQDSYIQVLEGVGIAYPFGSTYSPRVWNGTVYYEECGT